MTELVVGFEIEGTHYWPNAPHPHEEFENVHRHIFKVISFFATEESPDQARRELELWELRRNCINTLRLHFGEPCRFGARSCEGIADAVKVLTGANKVYVGEEWTLGAFVL